MRHGLLVHKSLAALFAMVIALALVVLACGQAATPTPAKPPPTAAPAPPTPAATATPAAKAIEGFRFVNGTPASLNLAPKRGGRAVFSSTTADPVSLDPTAASSVTIIQGVGPVYNQLVRCAYVAEMTNPSIFDCQLTSDLAKSWELGADGKSITFNLVQGVKWQNIAPLNGRELTSDDVKWALEQYKAATVFKSKFGEIASIETPDKYTVKVTLAAVNFAFLPGAIADTKTRIYPKDIAAGGGDPKKTAIGTGAFTLKEWVPKNRITFDKNPNYFRNGLPYLDGYDLLLVSDIALQRAAFRAGQILYAYNGTIINTKTELNSLIKDVPSAIAAEGAPDGSIYSINFNLQKSPWNDVRIRRAIALGINHQQIVDTVFEGNAVVAPLYPWKWVIDKYPAKPSDYSPWYAYDPQKAKQILAEAGYAGKTLDFPMNVWVYQGWMETYLQAAQDQLKAIGVNLIINKMEYAAYLAQLMPATYSAGSNGFAATEADIDGYTYATMFSTSSRNQWGLKDPQVDKLATDQRMTGDPQKRRDAVKQIFAIERDQVWRIPMPQPIQFYVYSPKLHNFAWSWRLPFTHFGSQLSEILWIE